MSRTRAGALDRRALPVRPSTGGVAADVRRRLLRPSTGGVAADVRRRLLRPATGRVAAADVRRLGRVGRGRRGGAVAPPSFARPQRGDRAWADGHVPLIAVMVVLSLIGLVMVLSASSVQSLRQFGSPWYYFRRQAMWLLIGALAFIGTMHLNYRRLRPLAPFGVFVALAFLVAVLFPGVGVNVSGSSRWIGVGSWRLQPSELAKLALVIFAAAVLDRRADRIRDWRYSMLPVVLAFGAMAGLIMIQPDMGTTMILACIVLAALFVAGSPLRPLTGMVLSGAVLSVGLAVAAPYRLRRMTAFLHPFADASNAGYQSAQGLVAAGSGGIIGMGLGATRAATGYLPNQYTDFIFAIIGEETGLVGSLLVVGLFVALAVVGIRVACRAPDRFGSLLAAGVTAWLVGQAGINIGAVVGLVPVTGVPLPLVSFGGSSLIIAMAALGIVCNIAKQGQAQGPGRHAAR